MTKSAYSDWDTTAANNTDIGGISLAEGVMLPSSVNNAVREMMAQLKAGEFVGTGAAVAFTDSLFTIKDNSDATKIAAFQASGITTATTRTYTFPDATGTFVLDTATQTLTNKSMSDSTFWIVDETDATKKVTFQASGITTATTRTLTFQDATGTLALLDVADQVVTGGARVTSLSLGTVSSGTLTLDPGDRPLQHYTNGGAHTLAPGTNTGTIMLQILNNASAGAITTSGFTKVVGAFTTTNGHKFLCSVVRSVSYSLLTIQALQ